MSLHTRILAVDGRRLRDVWLWRDSEPPIWPGSAA